MAIADGCYLNIPFKEYLKRLKLDADGKIDAKALDLAASQEFENYKAIERRINDAGCGGTGKPYATYVVAPYDSLTPDAARADLVLTGSGDAAAIQALVNTLDIEGGKLLFLDGEILMETAVELDALGDGYAVVIQGMGPSTQFKVNSSAGAFIINGTNWGMSIRDCEIRASVAATRGIYAFGLLATTIQGVLFTGLDVGIEAEGEALEVVGCHFWNTTAGVSSSSVSRLRIAGCTFDGGSGRDYAWVAASGASSCLFTNNSVFIQAVNATGGLVDSGILDNNIEGVNSTGTSPTFAVIRVTGGSGNRISGNRIANTRSRQIWLEGSSSNHVADNVMVGYGTDSTDPYDCIYLSGDSNKNSVQSNKIIPGVGALDPGNSGINISAAACDDNIVTNNDVRGTWLTAGIIDSGTGTLTGWGNFT